jgi:hypothetical protein
MMHVVCLVLRRSALGGDRGARNGLATRVRAGRRGAVTVGNWRRARIGAHAIFEADTRIDCSSPRRAAKRNDVIAGRTGRASQQRRVARPVQARWRRREEALAPPVVDLRQRGHRDGDAS